MPCHNGDRVTHLLESDEILKILVHLRLKIVVCFCSDDVFVKLCFVFESNTKSYYSMGAGATIDGLLGTGKQVESSASGWTPGSGLRAGVSGF